MSPRFSNSHIDYLKTLVAVLPEKPGIYQYFDNQGIIIYIGKAKNLKKRVASYFSKVPENRKTALLIRNIADIKHMVVDTEEDALLLENNLIKRYKPRYNIQLKDDKTYPWICIKKEPLPRIFKTRKIIRDGSEYFGPYTSVNTLNSLIWFLHKLFKIRTCSYFLSKENIEKRKFKACLEYHIGNCKGPCEGFLSEEQYGESITQIRDILKGNVSGAIKKLRKTMTNHAANYEFEKANEIKEKLIALEKYQTKSTVASPSITDVDVFTISADEKIAIINFLKIQNGAIIQTHTIELIKQLDESDHDLLLMAIIDIRQKIYSNSKEILVPFPIETELMGVKFLIPQRGDKKKLLDLSQRNATYYRLDKEKQKMFQASPQKHSERILETLKNDLHLKEIPYRIECFDNSNFQGSNPVAACVVFINGKPAKREYRHFNVKTVEGPNDFASMEEIVLRRYKRQTEEKNPLPQLIVIDGGKGQLSAAVQALSKLNISDKIPVIGIAKRLEEIYFPGDQTPIYLNKKSESLKLIQQLRDEAHRFGITFHRQQRSKNFISNELETIKGIGPETAKRLLQKYKSVKNVRELAPEMLKLEVGAAKAKLITDHFSKGKIEDK